jgi:hypothetical protein
MINHYYKIIVTLIYFLYNYIYIIRYNKIITIILLYYNINIFFI